MDSPWDGEYERTPAGLILPAGNPRVLKLSVELKKHTDYYFHLGTEMGPIFYVDLIGKGFNSRLQKFSTSGIKESFWIALNSGDCRSPCLLRIFFKNAAEVRVSEFEMIEPAAIYRGLKRVLLGLLLISTVAYARLMRRLWITSLAIFVCFFVFYTNFTVGKRASDNMWYIPVAASLVHEGNLDLDEYEKRVEENGAFTSYRRNETGSVYNYFPVGPSLIAVPFVLLNGILGIGEDRVEPLIAGACGAASVATLFALSTCLGLSNRMALLFVSIFGLATTHFSCHSTGLWSHNVGLLLSLVAILSVISTRRWAVCFGAAILVLGYATRPDFAILGVALSAYRLLTRRHAAAFFASLAICGGLFFLGMKLGIGQWLPPYYMASRLRFEGIGTRLLGQVFSPNRGLLIFNPILILSVVGIIVVWSKRGPNALLYRLLSLAVLLNLVVIAGFPHWWGGWSYGPRLHAGMLGLFFVLMIPSIQLLQRARAPWNYPIRGTFVLLCCWGLFVHSTAVLNVALPIWQNSPLSGIEWNEYPENIAVNPERLWDWHDLQFFRRLQPPR